MCTEKKRYQINITLFHVSLATIYSFGIEMGVMKMVKTTRLG
jgi:hypothetical protein